MAANSWAVTPTGVTKNGAAITGYVAHALVLKNSTESNGQLEATLVVRVDDAASEAQRNAQVAALPTAVKDTLNAENALRPTVREIRAQAGDTITVDLGAGVVIGYGTAADVAGVDQL